jgi:hypothetical protein
LYSCFPLSPTGGVHQCGGGGGGGGVDFIFISDIGLCSFFNFLLANFVAQLVEGMLTHVG